MQTLRCLAMTALFAIGLTSASSGVNAQSTQTAGECSPIVLNSTGVKLDDACYVSSDKPELEHIEQMLNAATTESHLSTDDLRKLVAGVSVLLRVAYSRQISDAAKTSTTLHHIESILSDLETTVSISMINNGAVSSYGPGSIAAGNLINNNGMPHSKLYVQIGDCIAEGFATANVGQIPNITDKQIDDADAKAVTWANKVAAWLQANMRPEALAIFLNTRSYLPMTSGLGSDHKDQEKAEFTWLLYIVPIYLQNLSAIEQTDLYDPPDTSGPHPGVCKVK